MRRLRFTTLALALASGLGASVGAAPQAIAEGCATCHGKEARELATSVHGAVRISCVDCHGGVDGTVDQAEAHGDGLRVLGDPVTGVESCAACHSDVPRMRGYELRTDQASLYWESPHGKAVRDEGAVDAATCVSCHGSHAVYAPWDLRSSVHKHNQPATCGSCHADAAAMEPHGLSADVVDEYTGSVHGRALLLESRMASPACSDCHGSHGAMPPRVDELSRVCGSCHTVAQGFFEEGPHADAARAGAMEECSSCHGHHRVLKASAEMLASSGGGTCALCHQGEDDPGLAMASRLYSQLHGLDARIEEAQDTLRLAAASGLFIEREHGFLDDARSLRARAAPLTHALSSERLADMMSRGQAMIDQTHEGLAVKERALRDRKIMTGIFFGVCLLLVGVLQTYRREAFGSWGRRVSGSRGGAPSRGTDGGGRAD